MSYETIHHSNIYYSLNGYQYIQTPWLVNENTSNITKPNEKKNFFINDRVLVASGEQSFLELINKKELESGQYYQTTTPCFRDEIEDPQHKTYFMKTELIYFEYIEHDYENQIARLKKEVDKMANTICKNFFSKYLPVKVINLPNQSLDHYYLYDIVTDDNNMVELGSYGIRTHGGIIWAYGTGCAEPRLSYAVGLINKPGYHLELIPKTSELGSVEKIIEEYDEFIDSVKQGTNIMALVELSDLMGAIDFYLKKNHNMNIEDLLVFNKITQRAFINGRRK